MKTIKTYGGMKVEGDRLTKKQIESRKAKLMRKKNSGAMPKKHGKARIRVERTLEIPGEVKPRVPKSFRKFQGVCFGKSKKRCPDCDGHLLRWKEALGKSHLSCPRCGNKDGLLRWSKWRRWIVRRTLREAGIPLRG
jgi:ribosomal protein S14